MPEQDLWPALGESLARQAERSLGPGVLQGYVTAEEALPLVRGRIRVADQIARRPGMLLPLEVRYDDSPESIPASALGSRTWTDDSTASPCSRPGLRCHRPARSARGLSRLYPGPVPRLPEPSKYPNADVYQMLAYCTALGLRQGWLVYAQGSAPSAPRRVRHTSIEIIQYALNLDASPRDLLAEVSKLAAEAVSQTAARLGNAHRDVRLAYRPVCSDHERART